MEAIDDQSAIDLGLEMAGDHLLILRPNAELNGEILAHWRQRGRQTRLGPAWLFKQL